MSDSVLATPPTRPPRALLLRDDLRPGGAQLAASQTVELGIPIDTASGFHIPGLAGIQGEAAPARRAGQGCLLELSTAYALGHGVDSNP